jgi:hypothetical protein
LCSWLIPGFSPQFFFLDRKENRGIRASFFRQDLAELHVTWVTYKRPDSRLHDLQKIRDDTGYWNRSEAYISEHLEAESATASAWNA